MNFDVILVPVVLLENSLTVYWDVSIARKQQYLVFVFCLWDVYQSISFIGTDWFIGIFWTWKICILFIQIYVHCACLEEVVG